MSETFKSATEIHVGPFQYSENAMLAVLLCLSVAALALAAMIGTVPASDAALSIRLTSVQLVAAYLISPMTWVAGYLFHRAGSKTIANILPLIGVGFLAGALGSSLL
ncbi:MULTISPECIES: hypothetical protein [Pseudomonas]|uniref:Uncharacterized protein n=1 Tax=Pseudomonas nitroreducens TaxID=46680 RepID=A0A6G6J8J7_PSENT|nr:MULTISPECIES: hypothetical protein [Pseudomonas]MDU4254116.1 hypothetical protein [Pseudomonas sp.]QIE91527.1 hypothetical protein G5B91_34930 [Pseudomonas nitroreducens]